MNTMTSEVRAESIVGMSLAIFKSACFKFRCTASPGYAGMESTVATLEKITEMTASDRYIKAKVRSLLTGCSRFTRHVKTARTRPYMMVDAKSGPTVAAGNVFPSVDCVERFITFPEIPLFDSEFAQG
jgi:hypothetical protein